MDYFRAYVEDANGVRTLVQQELGAATTDLPGLGDRPRSR